jgi:hypothetical protein
MFEVVTDPQDGVQVRTSGTTFNLRAMVDSILRQRGSDATATTSNRVSQPSHQFGHCGTSRGRPGCSSASHIVEVEPCSACFVTG